MSFPQLRPELTQSPPTIEGAGKPADLHSRPAHCWERLPGPPAQRAGRERREAGTAQQPWNLVGQAELCWTHPVTLFSQGTWYTGGLKSRTQEPYRLGASSPTAWAGNQFVPPPTAKCKCSPREPNRILGCGQPIPEPCLQWHLAHDPCFSVLPASSVPSGLIRRPKQRCPPGNEANSEFCLLLCIVPSLKSRISLTRGPRQQQSPSYSLTRPGKQARIPIQDLSAAPPPLPSHLSGLWAGALPQNRL